MSEWTLDDQGFEAEFIEPSAAWSNREIKKFYQKYLGTVPPHWRERPTVWKIDEMYEQKNLTATEIKNMYGSAKGHLSIDDFNKAKEALKRAYIPMTDIVVYDDCIRKNALDCCPAPIPVKPAYISNFDWKRLNNKEQEEANMRNTYNTAAAAMDINVSASPITTDLAKTREYFLARLNGEGYMKRETAYDMFLREPHWSDLKTTALIQKIKDGKFLLKDGHDKPDDYPNPMDFISFRDKPADQDAYDAACKKVSEDQKDAADAMHASDEAGCLKVLQDFKSKTFH